MDNKNRNCCSAAFSQADITPDFPVEMIGCYRADQRPAGTLYPLLAQVLLFRHWGEYRCLIAIDSLGLTVELSQELRARVAEELGGDPAHVMLNFSHTHSAPAPKSPLNGAKYYALLCERVVACVREARSGLVPCRVGWAQGETEIGENRREGCDTVDRRLGALQVVRADSGAPIALLLRVCAHANVLMTHSDRLSSDYFGPAREKIAAHFGCPAMLVQGASGNVKPAGVDSVSGGGLRDAQRIAELLLRSAKRLRFAPREVTRMWMCEREISLISDVPAPDRAEQIRQKAGLDAAGWLAECARLRAAGIHQQVQNGRVHFLFLNEGCLCGVPDEIFCELALAVSERCRSPLVFFGGYTNGCTGYLPHREEWVKGGYETFDSYLEYYGFHGHVLPFRADTAERLVDLVAATCEEHSLWPKPN